MLPPFLNHSKGRIVERQFIANLVVPSASIIACDPLACPDGSPFTTPVAAGTYPVSLDILHFASGDQRVAMAWLLFSGEADVATWKMAVASTDAVPDNLKEGEFRGYGVDAGTGCFMSEEAQRALLKLADDNEEDFFGIVAEMDKNAVHTWCWLDKPLDSQTGANLVAFSSGYGDGVYPSFFGYDADHKLLCLVTDFLLFS